VMIIITWCCLIVVCLIVKEQVANMLACWWHFINRWPDTIDTRNWSRTW
jgi:hypothetical protein